MSRKRQEDIFSSTALALPTQTSDYDLIPFERSRELARAERRISGEAHKQRLIVREQHRKTEEADWAMAQLGETEAQAFAAMMDSIWAIKTGSSRDPECQAYIDQFADHTIRSCGRYISAATEAGLQRIVEQVNNSLYFATEEERRSLLARLRGER